MALAAAHACMGLLMLLYGYIALKLYKKLGSTSDSMALSNVTFATVMAFSVAVVTVDQWVTPNITPFLIPCVLAGLAIYLRPSVVLWIYALGYIGFYLGLGWTQSNLDQLASNRLNGIAASVMGGVISVLMWRNFATIKMQQAQLEQANEELKRLSHLDGLTGLYNRNTLVEWAKIELERAQRQGGNTSILLIDLDHFKAINDTWGHPAGDAALRVAADVASNTVRSTDLVGRLGGEEFIVLLPGTSVSAAAKLAEKLRDRLERTPIQWESQTLKITASIGVACARPQEKMSFETLYAEADAALYDAKAQGRNCVVAPSFGGDSISTVI